MPNKFKFDKEYSTMYFKEINFLTSKGIKPTFIRDVEGLKIYKYEKTPQLFEMLRIFYIQN